MDNLRFSSAPTADAIDASIAQHYPDCEPVAVIGYACHFPESPDGETFWQNLLAGRECSRRFTREALLVAGLDAAIIDDPHYVNIGTVLENAECFDAALFGYSRQEAESIDPQQRLFLQAVWQALEHAGYAPGTVPHKTGVFASSRMSTYPGREALNVTEVAQVKGLQSLMGNDKDYIATRAAYKLNLHGPALSVQTACSSSLVAVHLACESLRAGESDMAVAGGVALSFPQQAGYRYQPGMIFSPDGRCRPFDASAEGTWAGNGLGCVVLRRLRDALLSGDPIISVILSSAVNNDGNRKVGYTAPSAAGQQAVIEEALMLAAIDDKQVGYIETHGTGTPLGDAIEMEALRNVYAPRPQDQRCALGSVKSNMGHLDTAAGIAGLLKTVLAVSRGQIPPMLHFHTPNPALKLEESPFTIPLAAQEWPDEMRYAGVSSFGIGGTNCHMIVASIPYALKARLPQTDGGDKSRALLLSAASDSALRRLAADYAGALRQNVDANNLAFTALYARRLDLPFRLAAPLNTETAAALSAWATEKSGPPVYSGHGACGKQVWLFTGQGSHWRTMGQAMYQHSAAFADTLDRCFSACKEILAPALQEAMFNPDSALLDNMAWAQPAIVAFEIAMAAQWSAEGLKPDFAIGHSVGEFAAAVVCGHYTIEQVMPLVCQRGALMQQCASGAMVAVFAEEDALMPLARRFELDLAANNGTQHTVFSGPEARLAAFCAALSQQDISYRRLSVTGAAHSALLEPILDRFQAACAGLHAAPGQIQLISTLTAAAIDESALNQADYWRRHMRQPVRFIQSIQVAHKLGASVFLEMGPDAQLVASGQREYRDNVFWIASARRHKEASDVLNQALLRLYAAGVALPWADLLAGDGQRISAPCYPFDTERYWKESASHASEPADAALSAGLQVASTAATALDLPRLEALKQCATRLHAIYVDQLVRRCTGDTIENGVDATTIMRRGRLLPRYQQLLRRLLNNCVVDGDYRCTDGRYYRARPIEHEQRESLLTELAGYCEGFQAIPDTIARAGDRLYEMMSGAEEPVAIIFPQGASDGVEVLYQEFSFGRYFNQIAAGVLRGIVQTRQSHQPLRILEVGGGTGGTTAWLLPELEEESALEYHFTDISALFTRRAQQKFARYDFVHYNELDLEKEAQSQGFRAQSYDLIVAANVIHATRHIGRTLDNLRPLLKPGGRLLMREITQPMRLFDFVFGPLVLPLQDIDARKGELFLTTGQWEQQCRHAGFSKVDWLPQDGSQTAGMSEHIILATLPGKPVSEVALTAQSEPVLGQALTADGYYLADWSDCARQPERFNARWQEAWRLLSQRHGDDLPVVELPLVAVPEWLGQVRLSWRHEAFFRGRMRVEARHPDGEWRPLSPATRLPAPQTHYQWQWSTLNVSNVDRPLAFCFSSDTLARGDELAQYGIINVQKASLGLMIVEETEDVLALAEKVAEALSTCEAGLVVVTRRAWCIQENKGISPSHHALWALLRVAANEQPERLIAAIDLDENDSWETLYQGLSAVSLSQRWLAVRDNNIWLPSLVPNEGCVAELPVNVFVGDDRWHLVTGAFGGLGRLAVSWLREKGARRIALLAPRVDESWLRDVDDGQIRVCPCDVGDAGQLAAVLEKLAANGGIAGAIHAAGVLADAPLQELDKDQLSAVFAVKAQAANQLLQTLRRHDGRYLILYSSAAATLGAPGQSAHALACGYLDGLSRQFSTLDAPKILSIAWGAWGESGRAATPEMLATLASRGMGVLSDAEGCWHLEQAVMRGAPWRLAMRVFTDKMPPLQQALFSAGAAEKPAPSVILRADDNTFSGSLSDETAVMTWLKNRIAIQLRLNDPASLSPHQDLLQLGMDSLLFLELSSDIQHYLGVRINAERAWQDLSPGGLTQLICSQQTATPAASQPEMLQHDAGERYAPFPLTPIQHAYWLGRTHLIGYGGVACHVLFEWDKRHDEFALAVLEKAWNQLIARHDMLRMVVDADGQQRILAETPKYRIPRHDLRQLPPEEQLIALEKRRHELSYRVLPADRWPLFELVVSEIDDRHYRLHMNLDLLQFDVQSFKVMMDDLAQVWRGETLAPLDITFRDYVVAEQARRQTSEWHDAWDYWQEKLPHLPLAPELPVVKTPAETPHFTTFKSTIAHKEWQALKQRWQQQGVTPSAALLTLFAATLERWSRTTAFTLNLTFFNRRPIHPQINQLIGDFTSVTLVDFSFSTPVTLQKQMQQTQQRLWQNMAHSEMNGVEVIRELGRLRGSQRQPLMPVVFTSMLGMTLEGMTIDQAMSHLLGEPCYVFTQTPQVWLDHQVMESDGELIFSWYCMDNVLKPGVAEAMFNDYCTLLQTVIARPESLNNVAEHISRQRWPLNARTDYDLRDIEQATLEFPGILQARAEMTAEDSLTLDFVMADDPSPSAAIPDEPALAQLAQPLPEQAQLDELDATWRWLEARALQGIAATLNRHGLFTAPEMAHRFTEMMQALAAQASYQRLLRQWLHSLTQKEWLIREGEIWRCRIPLSDIPAPQQACPESQWSQALAQYLETCIARHDALFSGHCSPLELLFNEQHSVTDALYRDNPASACLNRYAAQIAALCGAERILEVGAGTAATTAPMLTATRNTRQSYHFTDVSVQFLNDAREYFRDESRVSYALFDINQPLDFTAHPEEGYDLIVAANVLHDASHVVQALRRLRLLLKAGGRLLIVEATERNSVFQLASVGFIEGLSGYRDFRRRDEKPMLTRSAWQEVLVQAGFENELAWPAQQSSPLRQHLLVARSPGVNRPDKAAVSRYLQQRFGTGLPGLQIRQREELFTPLRAQSAARIEPAEPTSAAEGNPAQEKQVAELWQALLSRPVARHHDFFELGGDSLMATRMVAQLNQRGIARANLQDLFTHSTLSDFCAHLQACSSGEDNPVPICQGDGDETLFVFHASDGDISAWLPLSSALNTRVFGLQAKSPRRFATLDQMIDEYAECIRRQQPHGPYVLAGWSYGAFLAAGAAQRLYAKGEQVRIALIDPVCRQDFCCENRAALLRLLAEGQTPLALPEHFDQQAPASQLADFIGLAKAAGMVSQNLTLQAAETWLDNIAHLLRLLTEHTPGETVPVPGLIVYAAGRPAHWTPVETEWQTWINNADDYSIEASHWQIMMEAPHVQACAQHIKRWLCATSKQPENTL
ncbi:MULTISPECIES: yersiniabactin polyketide synthase HMWP1 [Brenneria]|uniref:Yersiniabactin polyketide synthase HMWP1 n=1 Tax=Brenneria nigrifluens DSM 30175 = ATCC 13028 TaxID=1121120 RepID=A0A2U1UPJ9_9GAMM|nr:MULTISPECIES: yersiniabactin polyketide synthase HMWP1 [Brenneria]EHD21424.1 6-deoxyerythronolide-B synthase., Glutamate racemase [Brenneria sp. EniD312]PWC23567.1 yersiniabactin polyketide synthase HMWP1 [Brenneria nigrifluens DSM 30175 = ATCC 13028]QCR04549.1 yersiniabactin polyketide synthase HMWP1 [Brenneria nigrifluens DSM 30175 = ATCC 13028]